ncbi:MAG TPA: type II secretion system protein [Gemmatimonadaceae bacterium]|nr:type II secretion system protein [Gemmatimonadaceae bacterium]
MRELSQPPIPSTIHTEQDMKARIPRRGFTLVETVVTVGIIAALAAVVYPTVVKQFDSADPTRVAEDLGNIRTALEAFGVNVRPELPHDLEDLVNRPDLTTDSTALDAFYLSSEQGGWNGPYLGISVPVTATAADTVTSTGYNARIVNRLAVFDEGGGAGGLTGGDSVAAGNASQGDFIAVRIPNLSGAAFSAVNSLIDGPSEDDAVEAVEVVKRRTLGRFRCPYSGAAPATNNAPCPNAYYLAVSAR